MKKRRNGPKPRKLNVARVQVLAVTGATNEQIAAELGISVTSLKNIRRRQKGVDRAIKQGKDKADLQVVTSLFNKAIGGDVVAMIFWLKNRQPGQWKDRHEVRGSVSMTARLSMAEMKKSLKKASDEN